MFFDQKKFNCKHTKLTKNGNTPTMYKCDNCQKTLMIIPVKQDPIQPDFFPDKNHPFRFPGFKC